jgi:hypothetical protein
VSMSNPTNHIEIITSVQRRRRWTASEKVRRSIRPNHAESSDLQGFLKAASGSATLSATQNSLCELRRIELERGARMRAASVGNANASTGFPVALPTPRNGTPGTAERRAARADARWLVVEDRGREPVSDDGGQEVVYRARTH